MTTVQLSFFGADDYVAPTQPADRQARLRLIRGQKYDDYLASPEWKAFRQWALLVTGHRCERCGRSNHLQVHHRSYQHVGAERLEDVTVVCRRCHQQVHGLGAEQADAA